jgi:transcription termination/antitermination protein NusA
MMTNEEAVLAALFAQEITEIASGLIEIKAVARRAGVRSKIAVCSHDRKVDCVGLCVGKRGVRIRNVVAHLGNERLDIFRWYDSPEKLIEAALQPSRVEQVVLHPAQHRATIVVKDEEQLSLALGRGSVNRDLASRVCGWEIDVVVKTDDV